MNNELLFVLIVMMMLFSKSRQSDLKNGTFFAFLIIGILPLGLLTMTQISKAHSEKETIGLDSIFTNSKNEKTNDEAGDNPQSPTSPETEQAKSKPSQTENNVEIKRQVKDT
jgi:hypothetical protein